MRCEEVQEYLAERLAGSLSDRLSGTVHTHVRTHMLSCSECCEELEDFEEMQTVLRSIPLEPCDPIAMRARFDLLMGAKKLKEAPIPAMRLWPLSRPSKIIFSLMLAVVAIAAAFFAVRQVMQRISVARIVPSVPAQTSQPAAAPVRTGAMSGQIRIGNGELSRRIRVAVISVPKAGAPSIEIAADTSDDGRYRLDNIPVGQYYVLASSVEARTYYPGSPDIAGATIVSVQAGTVLEGIDFPRIVSVGKSTLPVASSSRLVPLTGRVLLEDGSEVSDNVSPGEIAMSPAEGAGSNSTVIVKLDAGGRFSHSFMAGEYRFRVAVLPQDYVVRSVTSGAADLLKDRLFLSGESPTAVEIRVARRTNAGTGKIAGTVVDSATNAPSQADRVVLCCFASGSVERISTPLRSDGTFEFNGVPSGSYTAELRGSRNLAISNPSINVSAAGISGVRLFSAAQLVTVDVTIRQDNGDRLPYRPDTSIVFTGTAGAVRVAASSVIGNLFRASVPANESYVLTVSNVATGYTIQSAVDDNKADLLHGGLFMANARRTAPSRIVITLSKN